MQNEKKLNTKTIPLDLLKSIARSICAEKKKRIRKWDETIV